MTNKLDFNQLHMDCISKPYDKFTDVDNAIRTLFSLIENFYTYGENDIIGMEIAKDMSKKLYQQGE